MTIQPPIFDETLVEKLAKALENDKNNLKSLYQWPIEGALGKSLVEGITSNEEINNFKEHKDVFSKTLALRLLMQKKLSNSPNDETLAKYINWIVKDWGKIKRGQQQKNANGDTKLIDIAKKVDKIIDQGESPTTFPFDGIASWSKYVAFKHPDKYAIYDARVIYSLNWLLFKHGSENYFPEPDTQNTVMKAFDYSQLVLFKKLSAKNVIDALANDISLREKKPGSKSQLMRTLRPRVYLPEKTAYSTYCDLLNSIAAKLYTEGHKQSLPLLNVEMILFSVADKTIAMDVVETLSKHLSVRTT